MVVGEDGSTEVPAVGAGVAEAEVGRERYGEAKVACEQACARTVGDRLLVARPGLIGGPGDHTGRSGYWVARAARAPLAPMLVPASPDAPTQVIDVRDSPTGCSMPPKPGRPGRTYNAVGPIVAFREWIELSRSAARGAGLRHCPPAELFADLLGWEREQGVDRPRLAGLSPGREQELVRALAGRA